MGGGGGGEGGNRDGGAAQGGKAFLVHGYDARARGGVGLQGWVEGDVVRFLAAAGAEGHAVEVHGGHAAAARREGGEGVVVFQVADYLVGGLVGVRF